MAREQPTTVYTEVQIDEDSISLTLISESGSNGAVVEDTERFTFDELQSLSGEHRTLRLSDESAKALVEGRRDAMKGQILDTEPTHPEPSTVLTDENAPSWSQDDGVEVTEVLSEVTAEEYVIEGQHAGQALDTSLQSWNDKTVADANPSYSPDETVILGRYIGGSKEYAFPASRLQ